MLSNGAIYRNGHELRSLQRPGGKGRIPCAGSGFLLGESAYQFHGGGGSASPQDIIAAVEQAGYHASVKGGQTAGKSPAADESMLEDHETPALVRRLIASLCFLIPLMYLSMGHTMWGWPLPGVLEGNHVAVGILQMLLAVIVMVINQKFFISGFKGLIHRAPNMDTLVAMGSGASFCYSVYALLAMSGRAAAGRYGGGYELHA